MKFTCETKELLTALNTARRAISSRSTMEILQGVLIEAYDGIIKVTGNDMELGCIYSFKANIHSEGELCLHSKMLTDLVHKLRGERITLTKTEGAVSITSGVTKIQLQTLPAHHYPKVKYDLSNLRLAMPQEQLKNMLRGTLFAININDMRPMFTGVKFILDPETGELTMIAMDGYKVAVRKARVNQEGYLSCIVPGKTLLEIQKLLNDEEDVQVYHNDKQLIFKTRQLTVVSPLIQGDVIDYKQFLYSTTKTQVKIEKDALIRLLEMASVFVVNSQDNNVPVILEVGNEQLRVQCRSNFGIIDDYITCSTIGDELKIGFNVKYLLETIRACDGEQIVLRFKDNRSHCVVTPENGGEFTYITAPVII